MRLQRMIKYEKAARPRPTLFLALMRKYSFREPFFYAGHLHRSSLTTHMQLYFDVAKIELTLSPSYSFTDGGSAVNNENFD